MVLAPLGLVTLVGHSASDLGFAGLACVRAALHFAAARAWASESRLPESPGLGIEIPIGGWGEASLQGQSTPTGRSFRPVRACVRAVLFMSNQG